MAEHKGEEVSREGSGSGPPCAVAPAAACSSRAGRVNLSDPESNDDRQLVKDEGKNEASTKKKQQRQKEVLLGACRRPAALGSTELTLGNEVLRKQV